MNTRGNGLLLHITSLSSRFGIGDLGPASDDFLQFLADAGQRYWQILPIHPTDPKYDNSPYHALSAFAYNPLLISPERMISDGFLEKTDLDPIPAFPKDYVDFASVISYKETLFSIAYERFMSKGGSEGFSDFCEKNAWWLDNYALFVALRKRYAPATWGDWPLKLKLYQAEAINEMKRKEYEGIQREQFLQYLFSIQWDRLRKTCKSKGIILIGDIPIYVDYDSADVWTNPGLFKLDAEQKPFVIAGVPPDYFSETGQVWNNPIYNWEEMEKNKYSWWIRRIEHLINHIDYVRIDHFRGLIEFWEIPAGSETAINGRWVMAPAKDFLRNLVRKFPYLPIIAEDLGIITPDVREVLREFSIPGMDVLLFAFGKGMAENPYIPHNITRDRIVYTGTHDNNPIQAWFAIEASVEEKKNLFAYVGREVSADEINMILIRMAMMSVANTAIIPVQDLLNLGVKSRMNQPGINAGNWIWKLDPGQLTSEISLRLRNLTEIYGRI